MILVKYRRYIFLIQYQSRYMSERIFFWSHPPTGFQSLLRAYFHFVPGSRHFTSDSRQYLQLPARRAALCDINGNISPANDEPYAHVNEWNTPFVAFLRNSTPVATPSSSPEFAFYIHLEQHRRPDIPVHEPGIVISVPTSTLQRNSIPICFKISISLRLLIFPDGKEGIPFHQHTTGTGFFFKNCNQNVFGA